MRFGLALLSLWATLSHATPAIDLLEAWQLASARDPIYAAQLANTQANQEQIIQARSYLLPYIDAVARLDQNDIRQTAGLKNAQSSSTNQWQLRLSQPLLDLSALAQLERSRYLAAISVLHSAEAKNALFLRVSQAYFDVLATQDNLRSLAAEQHAIEQQLQLTKLAFELGGATITDRYEAQSRLDLVNTKRIATENTLQIHKNQLSRLIGQAAQTLAPLNPNAELLPPEPPNITVWLSQASTNNLVVAKTALAVQAQKEHVKSMQQEHYPTLSLQARSGSQSNQNNYGPNNNRRALTSSIGLELSIPIYEGGAISSLVREAASLLQQANYEHENARQAATEATTNYFNSSLSGIQQVNALQAAERTSTAAVEANRTAYEIGARSNIDVLNAQQQLYETQRALAKARYDTLLDNIKLKSTVGPLQENDIAAISQMLIPAP